MRVKWDQKTKISFFANTDWYLYGFKLSIAEQLIQDGYEVSLISPPGRYSKLLTKSRAKWLPVKLSRRGINPVKELASLLELFRTYKKNSFDLVHHFTVKCVLFGTIAGKLVGTKHIVNSITGLGHVFISQSLGWKLARGIFLGVYKVLLTGTSVIFQNQSDLDFFVNRGIIAESQAFLVPGSGVDMQSFQYAPEPMADVPVVLLPARLLWEKGVAEFVEAAKTLNKTQKRAKFLLVGTPDEGNPSSVPQRIIDNWVEEGTVEWLGWQSNMQAVYYSANIVCLPSYREGLSKTLVEAAACGRAIVTTDIPGCKDVVEHTVNGLLVPPRDSSALANALEKLIERPTLREQMGKAGRARAEKLFSTQVIYKHTTEIYQQLLTSEGISQR
ncbi:MAG: glycosyltransferase family 4 protein [Anaerolineales bacterium]|nr:glycosyltransferase family 4 protein [Anaerolineales bacterium]